jgi:hypothetical protein
LRTILEPLVPSIMYPVRDAPFDMPAYETYLRPG